MALALTSGSQWARPVADVPAAVLPAAVLRTGVFAGAGWAGADRAAVESALSDLKTAMKGDDKELTVISPIEGTPAQRAGIRAGDHISRIEGSSTSGITTEPSACW